MNNDDILTAETIKKIIDSSLDSRARIDIETHEKHHIFIEDFIETKRRRRERMESVKTQLLGAAALGVFGFLYWVGQIVARKIGLNL